MNRAGWVGGSSNLVPGGPQHAFIWYGSGAPQDLGTLQGPDWPDCPQCSSGADGPNANGEAPVGSEISLPDPDGEDFCGYGTHLQCRGTVWRNGKLNELAPLPGRNSNAFGINDPGQVVGFAEDGVRDPTCITNTAFQVYRFQAAKWDKNGEIHVLPALTQMGDNVAFAFNINSRGQAVGSSGTCATQGLPPLNVTGLHAVVWDRDGSPTYLGTLGDAANTMYNAATAINDNGDVVGTSQFTDGSIHSFIWKKGVGMKDLGTMGAFATIAGCCGTVNNRDEVVGFSIGELGYPFGFSAFVWYDGVMKDLNTLIPTDWRLHLHLMTASSINEKGEITGQACVLPGCTVFHGYRATPK
jgi:probable HAF family extracellular repeat protein